MKTPTIAELPSPPEGRHGWPWDEAPPALPALMADGKSWPSISIVVPSFNQALYIEETIRSILLQGYPNLEIQIIDGGSKDGAVEIIRKYEPWLSGWVSEKDSGQSEAINKGFTRCSNEIFNWICSDDVLCQRALETVGKIFSSRHDTDVVAGSCFCQYDDEPRKNVSRKVDWKIWEKTPYAAGIWQPSCFYRRSLVKRPDLLRSDLHFCMDRELWVYFCSENAKWVCEDHDLSVYRFTGENKSVVGKQKILNELEKIYEEYVNEAISLPALLRKFWLPLVLANKNSRSSSLRAVFLAASRCVAAVLLVLYPQVRVRALQREYYQYSVW